MADGESKEAPPPEDFSWAAPEAYAELGNLLDQAFKNCSEVVCMHDGRCDPLVTAFRSRNSMPVRVVDCPNPVGKYTETQYSMAKYLTEHMERPPQTGLFLYWPICLDMVVKPWDVDIIRALNPAVVVYIGDTIGEAGSDVLIRECKGAGHMGLEVAMCRSCRVAKVSTTTGLRKTNYPIVAVLKKPDYPLEDDLTEWCPSWGEAGVVECTSATEMVEVISYDAKTLDALVELMGTSSVSSGPPLPTRRERRKKAGRRK